MDRDEGGIHGESREMDVPELGEDTLFDLGFDEMVLFEEDRRELLDGWRVEDILKLFSVDEFLLGFVLRVVVGSS